MSNENYYIPLNLQATEAHRLSWNQNYYSLEAILLFPYQLKNLNDIHTATASNHLILKLTPFEDQFRAKMIASLNNTSISKQTSSVLGLTLSLNIDKCKILDLIDFRQVNASLNAQGSGSVNTDNSIQVSLTKDEKESLIAALDNLIQTKMKALLQQPFVAFKPKYLDKNWQDRLPKSSKHSSIIPFQAIFPFSNAVERVYNNKLYVMDDLYCVTPECPCNEVTCIILSFDTESGREITHTAFKYHFEKKIIKPLPNFPNKLDNQEWFKQFSKEYFIDLSFSYKARYDLLRKIVSDTKVTQ